MGEKVRNVHLCVDKEVHKALKIRAIVDGVSVDDVAEKAFQQYLKVAKGRTTGKASQTKATAKK